jgi:hypothetical protein
MFSKVGDPPAGTRPLADYLTIGAAAEVLGISPSTLRNWDRQRKLATLRHPKNGYRVYRREDLEALLRDEGLSARLHQRYAPRVDWSALADSDHVVQFYEDDAFLVDAVSRYLAGALRAGQGAVLIASRSHRHAIERKLRAQRLDLARARAQGQFVALDAAATLARFMVGGVPDRKRFREVIGGLIARTSARHGRVRAFGEMVALLWSSGNRKAAIRLERLWSELQTTHTFVLQCGYPIGDFGSEQHGGSFRDVCACHSQVVPAESYAALASEAERLRAIAELQQKARALDSEIARRKRIAAAARACRGQLPQPLKDLLVELDRVEAGHRRAVRRVRQVHERSRDGSVDAEE